MTSEFHPARIGWLPFAGPFGWAIRAPTISARSSEFRTDGPLKDPFDGERAHPLATYSEIVEVAP